MWPTVPGTEHPGPYTGATALYPAMVRSLATVTVAVPSNTRVLAGTTTVNVCSTVWPRAAWPTALAPDNCTELIEASKVPVVVR